MRPAVLKFYRLSGEEKERILALLADRLSSRAELIFAIVFGGFLEERPFRDIDVGVYLAHGTRAGEDIVEAALYAEELSAELSKLVGLPVDVVVLNHAPVWLLYRALKGRVILDRDPVLRARLYLMALDTLSPARWHRGRGPLGE